MTRPLRAALPRLPFAVAFHGVSQQLHTRFSHLIERAERMFRPGCSIVLSDCLLAGIAYLVEACHLEMAMFCGVVFHTAIVTHLLCVLFHVVHLVI